MSRIIIVQDAKANRVDSVINQVTTAGSRVRAPSQVKEIKVTTE